MPSTAMTKAPITTFVCGLDPKGPLKKLLKALTKDGCNFDYDAEQKALFAEGYRITFKGTLHTHVNEDFFDIEYTGLYFVQEGKMLNAEQVCKFVTLIEGD
jgi:hypothetical protein